MVFCMLTRPGIPIFMFPHSSASMKTSHGGTPMRHHATLERASRFCGFWGTDSWELSDNFWMRSWDLTIKIWDLTIKIWDLTIKIWDFTIKIWDLTIKIWDLTIKIWDLTIKIWDLTIKIWDLTIKNADQSIKTHWISPAIIGKNPIPQNINTFMSGPKYVTSSLLGVWRFFSKGCD